MTIDFTCQKCEGSFELDGQDVIDGTEKLVCPHCDAKAPTAMVEDFAAALNELNAQVAILGKKFAVNLAIETEDVAEDEEEEEEDDEAEADEDDLDYDEDDDVDEDDDDETEDEDTDDR